MWQRPERRILGANHSQIPASTTSRQCLIWPPRAARGISLIECLTHLGGGEGRGLAGVVHDGGAVGEPDEHEGAAGGRADDAEAERGGDGRVHGAAAVAERVPAYPRAPPVVRRHGAVRRRHRLPAPCCWRCRGRSRSSSSRGREQVEEEEESGDDSRWLWLPLETSGSGCRAQEGWGKLSKTNG